MRRERGQTMVLFALTMMLLTLMVCMTLSFGAKAKEKLELQTVADEAAYSNAVATARTFNTMAVTNRAFVAEWAAMAGVESLMSWVAYYRSAVNAARLEFMGLSGIWFAGSFCCIPFAGCPQWCGCSITGGFDNLKLAGLFSKEETRLKGVWLKDDLKAAKQAYDLQSASSTLTLLGETPAYGWLLLKLLKQNLASGIVAQASAGSAVPGEWSAPNSGASVAVREAFNPLGGGGALLPYVTATIRQEAVWAAMGTRSHPFVTDRTFGQPIIQLKLTSLIKPPDTAILTSDVGSGYLHSFQNHSKWWPDGAAAWGDDHSGLVIINYGMPRGTPCPWPRSFFPLPASAVVYSPWAGGGGLHNWLYGTDPAPVIHEMGASIAPKGIITNYMDYNPIPFFLGGLDNPNDLYGQPKNYAVVQRDYHARPPGAQDPWNLFFNFRFVGGSAGSNFNINDSASAGGSTGFVLTDGQDISKQTALAAGITYYHRAGHWSEPPNMFNPFWRAGLVSSDIDSQGNPYKGGSDVPNTLNKVGAAFGTDAFNGLISNGFKGIQ